MHRAASTLSLTFLLQFLSRTKLIYPNSEKVFLIPWPKLRGMAKSKKTKLSSWLYDFHSLAEFYSVSFQWLLLCLLRVVVIMVNLKPAITKHVMSSVLGFSLKMCFCVEIPLWKIVQFSYSLHRVPWSSGLATMCNREEM